MKSILASVAILFAASTSAFACQWSFNGDWENLMSEQGQFASSHIMILGDAVWVETYTGMNGWQQSGNRTEARGPWIVGHTWATMQGNLTARVVNSNTCDLAFGAPQNTVPHPPGGPIARNARITLNGATMRLCWGEAGHYGGDCINFRNVD